MIRRVILAAVGVLLSSPSFAGYQVSGMPVAAGEAESVRIFVPPFEGPGAVGAKVANVFALQISRTFRESEPGVAKSFGRGVLIWDTKPLPMASFEIATREALNIGTLAHLVLWGKTYEIGEGAVVQPYLSVTGLTARRQEKPERWAIGVKDGDRVASLELGLPSDNYAFEPIVIKKQILETYRSISGLPIYADRSWKTRIGMVGPAFRAREYQRDAVRLTSGPVSGWVPLPLLSDHPTEVAGFSSALVRVLRGDWNGAVQLLDEVLRNPSLRRGLRVDAELLRGLAEERRGRSGRLMFERALALNSLNAPTIQYLAMERIERCVKELTRCTDEHVADIAALLKSNAYLFASNDQWFINANSAADMLAAYRKRIQE